MSGIAVLASRVRAEEKAIFAALDRRGTAYTHVDTRAMWRFAPGEGQANSVVLNREISYTRALYAARTLEASGATVVNSASATEVCGDKWRTSMALVAADVPTPATVLALTPDAALDALDELGYPAVIKPLVGSWGRLVVPVDDRRSARALLDYVAALPEPRSHVVYLQRMVAKPGRDIRVAVIGGRVAGAGYRSADDMRTNVARGAAIHRCEVAPELATIAVAAASVTGAEICGVDVLEDVDGGLLVLEVNHGLEFAGLQRALADRVDLAEWIVDYLLAKENR